MQNLFVTSTGKLLAEWDRAFPDARVSRVIDDVFLETARLPRTVIWVHAEASRQETNEIIGQVTSALPQAKIVVLANTPSKQHAFEMLSRGTSGYCHAYSEAALLKEVRAVVERGGLWLGRDLLQHLINVSTSLTRSDAERASNALNKLTTRERDVAIQVAKGLSNKEIARVLNITERTVKAHISACFERLKVKDRLQLALILNDKTQSQL